jgi:nucleotide-binding universal stress UspA family protein
MVTIQRILCAVEMRLDDVDALACACRMARPFAAQVDTLLVRDGFESPNSANARPERTRDFDTTREAELLFAELLASTPGRRLPDAVAGGEPRVILERSEDCASDLIVLGMRRLSAVRPERLAALADELSRRASCPVMTVPRITSTASISRILLPVDFSAATGRAVEWATTLAQRFAATIHVLHAVGSPALRETPARRGESIRATVERARGKLEEIEQRLRARAVACESSIVERGTTHAILGCRELQASDLIVMGVHHHGGDRVFADGMVATIRCRAPVPVLSMTTPESEEGFVLDPLASGADTIQSQVMSAGTAQ